MTDDELRCALEAVLTVALEPVSARDLAELTGEPLVVVQEALASIRDDLGHLYALSYYPQPNPNRGWRNITVKLVGKNVQQYHIRTRTGYRLLQTQAVAGEVSSLGLEPASKP